MMPAFMRSAITLMVVAAIASTALASDNPPLPGHDGLKDRLLESSRSLTDRTIGGFSKAKNAGKSWLHWTKYSQSGDKEALAALVSMAQEGSPEAQNILGHIQTEGIMRQANIPDGVHWFAMSADKGLGLARYNLGLLHLQGRGVPMDEQKAMALFRQSLEQEKIEQAMVRLLLNAHKNGDMNEAWKLANLAAEKKNRVGIYMVGRMLYEGSAPLKDPGSASRWLQQAAEMYSPEAAELLSRIYANDEKSPNREVMATAWKLIAMGMRRQGAGVVAQSVTRLDVGDREKAQRFASEWMGSHRRPQPTEYEKTLPLIGSKGN